MSTTQCEEIEDVLSPAGRSRILVIGGDRHLVSQLLSTGAAVRALASDPESAGLPADVDVVRGDLSDPDTLEACLDGVEAVFLAWPYDRRAARFAGAEAAPAVVDAVAKYARRIVFMSSHGVRDHLKQQAGPTSGFYANLERLIERSGLEWTFLRLCMPASITLNWAVQIRGDGIVR